LSSPNVSDNIYKYDGVWEIVELLKIKLEINLKRDVLICVLWGSAVLGLMTLFFMDIGNFVGDEILSDADGLLGLIRICFLVSLCIITAHLFCKHIVNIYITKKDNLIYTYPYSKKQHILSNLYLIILEILLIGIIILPLLFLFIYLSKTVFFRDIDLENIDFINMAISSILGVLSVISSCGILLYLSYKYKRQ